MNTQLICPRCDAAMENYDCSGVHIDQCVQCRGCYLDRGDLPRLIAAEAGYFQPQQPLSMLALR